MQTVLRQHSPMYLVLCRMLNHRQIELRADTRGQLVGVRRTNGEYRYVPWLGFVDRAEAPAYGRPVKLAIARVGRSDGFHTEWHDVPDGTYVQGCLTEAGAFAVTGPDVRIVS